MNKMMHILRSIRAIVMRTIKPKAAYFQFAPKSLKPLSDKFGFDRGTPVDRHYIEAFLAENAESIKGVCLEIHDDAYAKKYGGSKVTRCDVLDVDTGNKMATIVGDLRNIPAIASDTYDCVILTHTLGVIDDHESAARECVRILKPGGTLLVTVAALGVAQEPERCFWRYTPASLKYIFSKFAKPGMVQTRSYGNVLSGQAFWIGAGAEELAPDELAFNDPRYPVIVAGVVRK